MVNLRKHKHLPPTDSSSFNSCFHLVSDCIFVSQQSKEANGFHLIFYRVDFYSGTDNIAEKPYCSPQMRKTEGLSIINTVMSKQHLSQSFRNAEISVLFLGIKRKCWIEKMSSPHSFFDLWWIHICPFLGKQGTYMLMKRKKTSSHQVSEFHKWWL